MIKTLLDLIRVGEQIRYLAQNSALAMKNSQYSISYSVDLKKLFLKFDFQFKPKFDK
jgi:hypothetical protein